MYLEIVLNILKPISGPDVFSRFSQSLEDLTRYWQEADLKVSLEHISSTAFPVNSNLTIPSFDVVYHESHINK